MSLQDRLLSDFELLLNDTVRSFAVDITYVRILTRDIDSNGQLLQDEITLPLKAIRHLYKPSTLRHFGTYVEVGETAYQVSSRLLDCQPRITDFIIYKDIRYPIHRYQLDSDENVYILFTRSVI